MKKQFKNAILPEFKRMEQEGLLLIDSNELANHIIEKLMLSFLTDDDHKMLDMLPARTYYLSDKLGRNAQTVANRLTLIQRKFGILERASGVWIKKLRP